MIPPLRHALATLLALGAFAALIPRAQAEPDPGIALDYISGGIGDDSAVHERRRDYNLQLVFAEHGSGAYLADVVVEITDARGRPLLQAESPGPIFLVNLPRGDYRIRARYDGTDLHKRVRVRELHRRDLYFYWPRR